MLRHPARRPGGAHLGDEDGITLVEVLIASFILSVSLLAMASVAGTSLISLGQTRDREQATNAASAAIEAARSRDFADLAHAPGDASFGGVPSPVRDLLQLTDGDRCLDGRAVVRDGASSAPVPIRTTAGTNDAHEVFTLVSWADDDADCDTDGGELKRVTTVVTWTDRGQRMHVRNDTLVAPAARGLPVPDFELQPPDGSLRYTRGQLDADDTTRCVPHLLRNLGAADTYEWELTDVDREGDGQPVTQSGNGFRTMSDNWSVHAYLEYPATEPNGVPPDDALMRLQAGRLVSDTEVPAGESATFTVCYTLAQGTPDHHIAATSIAEVRSRFDERRVASVTHQIGPGSASQLYLQARDDLAPHARSEAGDGTYPPLLMTRLADDPAADPDQLDRTQYLGPELLDWSTDVGDRSFPGLRLRNTGPGAEARADWRYQVPSTTEIPPGTALLVLHVQPTSSLAEDPAPFLDDDDDWVAMPMELQVRLDVFDEAESGEVGFVRNLVDVTHDYEHTYGDWAQRVIELPISTLETITQGQRLRVAVTCTTASEEDCHLAYDAESHPAYLEVELQ